MLKSRHCRLCCLVLLRGATRFSRDIEGGDDDGRRSCRIPSCRSVAKRFARKSDFCGRHQIGEVRVPLASQVPQAAPPTSSDR